MAYNSTIDKATDDILIYGNTVKDGSGTSYVPLLDADGHTQTDVLTSALPTGASTLAEQQSQTTHLATIAGDTTSIQTAVELLDDIVKTEDTAHSTGDKGVMNLGVVNESFTALAAEGDYAPIQLDQYGRQFVYGDIQGFAAHDAAASGNPVLVGGQFDDTLPDSVDEGDAGRLRISANRNLYTTLRDAAGNERGLNVDANGEVGVSAIRSALPSGTNAIGKLAANSGVDIGDVDVTTVVPGTGATNLGKAEDAAHTTGDVGVMALAVRAATPTERSAGPTDGDYEPLATNEVGALWVTPTVSSTGGASTMNASSSDGGTALTSTAQAIKASAGCLYGYYIYNPNATAQFVQFYNTAQGSVTVGTTNPLFMLTIPATSGANLFSETGIQFSTAISWAATSTAGGNGAPTTALDAVAWYK